MKTNTVAIIVLAGILALSLAACSKSEPTAPKIAERTESAKSPKPQQPALAPLDQEAVALAEKTFSETWRQVGDSWFVSMVGMSKSLNGEVTGITNFYETKGVTRQVTSTPLSEADTLNGLQWQGEVHFSSRIHRKYSLGDSFEKERQWSEWRDGSPWSYTGQPMRATITLTKTKGQWALKFNTYDEVAGLHTRVPTKPSEEQIKNLLAQ